MSFDRSNSSFLAPTVTVSIVTVLWQIFAWFGFINDLVFPKPTTIFRTLVSDFDLIVFGSYITALESLIGFVWGTTLALVLFFIFRFSRKIDNALYPIIVMFKAVPLVALAPIVNLIVDVPVLGPAVMASIVAFFPILIAIRTAASQLPMEERDLMRVMGATWLQTFRHFEIQAILPHLFGGLRVGMTFAVVGAVVGEFIGGEIGLGTYIVGGFHDIRLPQAYAGVIACGVLGLILAVAVEAIELVFGWWEEPRKRRARVKTKFRRLARWASSTVHYMKKERLHRLPLCLIQSIRFWWQYQRRLTRLRRAHNRKGWHTTVKSNGIQVSLFDGVFSPEQGEGSRLLVEYSDFRSGERVLDMGTGSGIHALHAAASGATVVAIDVSQEACITARKNAIENGLERNITIACGDLFDCLSSSGCEFDTIVFNPPFMNGEPSRPFERAMFDPDHALLLRFLTVARDYLGTNGKILLAFSNLGDENVLFSELRRQKYGYKKLVEKGKVLRFYILKIEPNIRKFERLNVA